MKISKIVASLIIGAMVVGCGGGGSSSSNDTTTNTTTNSTLSGGQVSDGYIAGANVLVDINTTTVGKYDSGDINTTTDINGVFSVNQKIKAGTIVYATGGVNIATGEDFNGTMKAVFSADNNGSLTVTPLTSMVAAQVQEGASLAEAKANVAKALDIKEDVIDKDPVANKEALKAVQKVVAIAKVVNAKKEEHFTKVLDEIAKNLKNDSNLTKAVEAVADDNETAKLAIETANSVETVLSDANLTESSDNKDLENLVTQHIIEPVTKSVKENAFVEQIIKELNTTKNKVKSNDFKDVFKASTCLTFDKIKGENSSINSVTKPLDLSAKSECEENNVSITWESGVNVDINTGKVTQENYENKIAKLIALLAKNDSNLTKAIVMTIPALGHKPVANDDIVTVAADTNATIDVLANDVDKDGLSEDNITITTPPSHGKAEVVENKIKYTPNKDFVGNDTLTYQIIDPLGAKVSAEVKIKVIKSKVVEAINQIEGFDFENGDIDALINNVENTLKSAGSDEADAQAMLSAVELVKTIDDQLGSLVSLSDGSDLLDTIINKKKDVSIKISEAIDNLSDQTEESLSTIASSLKDLSKKIDELYAKDPNYQFTYKNFTLTRDDAKALSGVLMLEAGELDYLSAYNIVKKDYVETKKETINGKEVEYQIIKANPVEALNDNTTLSLNDNAQTHLNNAKSDILVAIDKLSAVDTSKVSDKKVADSINYIKPKIASIKDSITNGTAYVIASDDKKKEYALDLSALFNKDTAPTLANTLGNKWEYKFYEDMNATYDADISKYHNKAMATVTYPGGGQGIEDIDVNPINIPIANNSLTKVIKSIKIDGKTYKNSEVLKVLFGDFDVDINNYGKTFNSANDVNVTITIENSSVENTAPYTCSLDRIEAWVDGSKLMGSDVGSIAKVSDNECKLTIKSGITGSIEFEVKVTDAYGHEEHEHGWFNINN